MKIIVQLHTGISPRTVQEKFNKNHPSCPISLCENLSDAMNIWSYFVLSNDSSVSNELYKIPEVLATQYIYPITYRNTIPNDPNFSLQWNLVNNGKTGGNADADIDADLAWKYGIGDSTKNGDTIVIAIIDGGFDLQHEDLLFWKNKNEIPNDLVDNDNNGYVDDYDGWNIEFNSGNPHTPTLNSGHATAACGAAAAIGNNNKGIAGVAYGGKILPVHLGVVNSDSVIKAYNYVINMRQLYNSSKGDSGAFIVVVNSSFGLNNGIPANNAVWCNMYDFMGNIGIVSTVAAPNKTADYDVSNDVPGNCASAFIINTTNSTNKDELAIPAGYGKINVDIAAPASGVFITKVDNAYSSWSGTSFAAPQVAGAIAVLYSAACDSILKLCQSNPDQGALLIRDFILKNAETKTTFQNKLSSNGRLNLFNAVVAAKNYCGESTPNPSLGNNLKLYWVSYNNDSKELLVNYDFPEIAKATFCVYDISGKKIEEFVAEKLDDGNYLATFATEILSTGLYFITLYAENQPSNTIKFIVK
ncbi:MAG: S8 family serine peptidase [Bacteroidetes bacterium]|nr:S8 family serine peptidase [Bacteroidota bacterium]